MSERLTVRVPDGWGKKLDGIGKPLERDRSYLTRKALSTTYPQLTASEPSTHEVVTGGQTSASQGE